MIARAARRACWPEGDTNGKCACGDKVRIYSSDGRKRLLIPCGRRTCEHCGPWHWRPRVLAGLHTGLRGAGDEYLAVLLTAPGESASHEFNATASQAWNYFATLLRRGYPGTDIQYWRVAELQARGHVHFHVVVRGLRYLGFCRTRQDRIVGRTCCGKSGCLRQMALTAGFGSWVGVRRPRDYPGGVRSLGWYFGKYLLKHYQNRIGVTKLVTFSQGWRVGWKRHERDGGGRWLYGGRVGGSWAVLGRAVDLAEDEAAEWYPPWWWRSWQRARRMEEPPIRWDEGLGAAG